MSEALACSGELAAPAVIGAMGAAGGSAMAAGGGAVLVVATWAGEALGLVEAARALWREVARAFLGAPT